MDTDRWTDKIIFRDASNFRNGCMLRVDSWIFFLFLSIFVQTKLLISKPYFNWWWVAHLWICGVAQLFYGCDEAVGRQNFGLLLWSCGVAQLSKTGMELLTLYFYLTGTTLNCCDRAVGLHKFRLLWWSCEAKTVMELLCCITLACCDGVTVGNIFRHFSNSKLFWCRCELAQLYTFVIELWVKYVLVAVM